VVGTPNVKPEDNAGDVPNVGVVPNKFPAGVAVVPSVNPEVVVL
jgi:hypothetical protein